MYLEIYSKLPQQLLTMAETPAMQRLKHVGMHCGCEYTAYSGSFCLRSINSRTIS